MDRDTQKRAAAETAAAMIEDGMVVGLGTGSTARFAIEALIRRVREGLRIRAIPTSERSAAQAREGGIPLTSFTEHRRLGISIATFAEHQRLDLTIDGADEVQLGTLDLIKGLGGALLREKIVAAASERLVIVVDQEKLVEQLGEHTPIPVEVTQFGWQATATALAKLGCVPERRYAVNEQPFVTDGGNFILDCRFGPVADPGSTEQRLAMTVGTVESGLFVRRTSIVVVASMTGVEVLVPPERR